VLAGQGAQLLHNNRLTLQLLQRLRRHLLLLLLLLRALLPCCCPVRPVCCSLLLACQFGCEPAPQQRHMLGLQAVVLMLQHSGRSHPAVDASDALQQVHMVEAADDRLQQLQPTVLLLLLLLLLGGRSQVLVEAALMPGVLLPHMGQRLLLLACWCLSRRCCYIKAHRSRRGRCLQRSFVPKGIKDVVI
jgi:hypothetical protein